MIEKPHSRRIVVDTNVFVSAALYPDSPPDRTLAHAFAFDIVLVSLEALAELAEVIKRPKFNRLRSPDARQEYFDACLPFLKLIDIGGQDIQVPLDCRDPKDNKFLDLALSGHADLIITGDDDLLSLHPWHGIPILTPAAYLALAY